MSCQAREISSKSSSENMRNLAEKKRKLPPHWMKSDWVKLWNFRAKRQNNSFWGCLSDQLLHQCTLLKWFEVINCQHWLSYLRISAQVSIFVQQVKNCDWKKSSSPAVQAPMSRKNPTDNTQKPYSIVILLICILQLMKDKKWLVVYPINHMDKWK